MGIAEKIALSLTIWTALILTLVGNSSLELFIILILIGILITRELSSVYIRPSIATRLDICIRVGIIIFIAIVGRRILSILGIL